MEGPGNFELRHIPAIDLRKRRVAHASGIVAVIGPVRFRLNLGVSMTTKVDRSPDERGTTNKAQPSVKIHWEVITTGALVRQLEWDNRVWGRDDTDGRESALPLQIRICNHT